jgi:hypothetical protein
MIIELFVGVIGWFMLLGALHILAWIFGTQLFIIKMPYSLLIVASEALALFYVAFGGGQEAEAQWKWSWQGVWICIAVPWVLYLFHKVRKALRHKGFDDAPLADLFHT